MRISRSARAAAGLATAVALVAGCGSAGITGAEGSIHAEAAVEDQLLALYTAITGSVEQRRAFEAVNHQQAQDQVAACMRLGEFEYPRAAFIDPYPGWTALNLPAPRQEAADVSVERASTRAFGIGADLLARLAPPAQVSAYEGMSREEVADYDKALDGCAGTLDASLAQGLPDFVYPVSDRLLEVMTKALDSVGIPRDDEARPGYEACLAAAGFKAGTREELETQASLEYTPFLTSDGTLNQSRAMGSEWDAAVAFEKSAAIADANCRADDHARYLNALAPLLDSFTRDQAAAIDKVAAEWAAVPGAAN